MGLRGIGVRVGGVETGRKGSGRMRVLDSEGFLYDLEDLLVHVVGPQHPGEIVGAGGGHLGEGFSPVLPSSEKKDAVLLLEPAVPVGLEWGCLVAVGVEPRQVPG